MRPPLSFECIEARRELLLESSGPKHAALVLAEKHAAECEGCRRFVDRERATAQLLREAAEQEAVPGPVIPVVLFESQRTLTRSASRRVRAGLTAAALLVLGVTAFFVSRRFSRADAVEAMVADHLHYRGAEPRPAQVVSSEPAVLESWAARELGFHPKVERPAGYDLLGIRSCTISGQKVALVFYQKGHCQVSMFVGDPSRWPALPATAARSGVSFVTGTYRNLVYAAVGDMQPEELRELIPHATSDAMRNGITQRLIDSILFEPASLSQSLRIDWSWLREERA